MTEKTLSAKQINILTKNGIKEPWNLPYQEAADKIGQILSNYNPDVPVVKPGVPSGDTYERAPMKPMNGNGFRTPEQMIMCEMTSCAKDIFCAAYDKNVLGHSQMEIAINLVKQAKEAFE